MTRGLATRRRHHRGPWGLSPLCVASVCCARDPRLALHTRTAAVGTVVDGRAVVKIVAVPLLPITTRLRDAVATTGRVPVSVGGVAKCWLWSLGDEDWWRGKAAPTAATVNWPQPWSRKRGNACRGKGDVGIGRSVDRWEAGRGGREGCVPVGMVYIGLVRWVFRGLVWGRLVVIWRLATNQHTERECALVEATPQGKWKSSWGEVRVI